MTQQARVDSFSALREFRASLATFAAVAAVALDEVTTDIQRTLLWLREDRYRHWKQQVETCAQQYTQAKLALKQREVLDRAVAGTHSSCVEERRAVRIAEQRLHRAEEVFRLVRVYTNQIDKQSLDYKGTIHGLVNDIEVGIPNACASLDRMVDSLQQYVALAPPEASLTASEDTESPVTQPIDMPPAEEDVTKDRDENEDGPEPGRASP